MGDGGRRALPYEERRRGRRRRGRRARAATPPSSTTAPASGRWRGRRRLRRSHPSLPAPPRPWSQAKRQRETRTTTRGGGGEERRWEQGTAAAGRGREGIARDLGRVSHVGRGANCFLAMMGSLEQILISPGTRSSVHVPHLRV